MTQTTFARLTVIGRNKIAAALSAGTEVNLTHIAIGSGAQDASGDETALTNEVQRKLIAGKGTSSTQANQFYVTYFLEVNDGPFSITEAGIIDDDGDLIAIAAINPAINKPNPATGQVVSGFIRIEIAVENADAVNISVDPSFLITLEAMSALPWIAVLDRARNTPPTDPSVGDIYQIGASPTGAWSGFGGQIAEFTLQGWQFTQPVDGHGIGLPNGSIYVRSNGTYTLVTSVQLASQEEFDNESSTKAATPKQVHDLVDALPDPIPRATLAELQNGSNVNKYVAPNDARTELDKKLNLTGGTVTGELRVGNRVVIEASGNEQLRINGDSASLPFIPLYIGAERKGFLQAIASGLVLVGEDGGGSSTLRLQGVNGATLNGRLGVTGSVVAVGNVETDSSVFARSGNIYVDAPAAGSNAHYWMRDENGQNIGLLFSNRATNSVQINAYEDGVFDGSFVFNGANAFVNNISLVASTRTLSAGLGLNGGGSLANDLSFTLALNELPAVTTLPDGQHVVVNAGAAAQNVPRQISMANFKTAVRENPPFNAVGHEDLYTNNGFYLPGDTVSGIGLTIPNATGVWQLRSLRDHQDLGNNQQSTAGFWRKIS